MKNRNEKKRRLKESVPFEDKKMSKIKGLRSLDDMNGSRDRGIMDSLTMNLL